MANDAPRYEHARRGLAEGPEVLTGPLASQIVLAMVGIMTFDSIGKALVPPAI
jgi:hypothetical protein